MPWQQAVADVAYEYDPVTGRFRYSEVVVTIPRQSGKSLQVLAVQVHRTTVMAHQLGPQRSTYTAQTRAAARRKLERDFGPMLAAARSFREVPHARAKPTKATEYRLSLNNGSENILFGSGSYLQIDAPTATAGHGDTLDLGVIDEAFAQDDDAIEGAMVPAMATRSNAQLWVISTAGTERSFYLWRKIQAGRAASGRGDHGRVAYFEWSAPEDADPSDPEVWRACMPALGHTVTEDFIRTEWERAQRKGPEGVDTFRRAYLNQWPKVPVLPEESSANVVDLDRWAALTIGNQEPTSPVLSLEVALDRSAAHIGMAFRVDGKPHLERQPTTVAEAVSRCRGIAEVTGAWTVALATNSEAASLQQQLTDAGFEVITVNGPGLVAACGTWHDLATQGGLSHNGDPAVSAAIAAARWKDVGDGARVLTRRHGDIHALYAVVLALHGLASAVEADCYVI